ncbi:MAG TPA: hypothetical protein VJ843_04510 [Candidatus Saccharimonadales bacterium]|nr:hypothetical protein [Candidatus Saccharimonadales bacterium]
MNGFRKAALWALGAVVAAAVFYIAYPQFFTGPDHSFKTPKGDYVMRLDKSGNPTAFIPDGTAQQNHVQLVVTFKNGVKKTCGGQCPIDGQITKIEAKVDDKVIATWP